MWYFRWGIVYLNLRKEYFNMTSFKIPILLLIKSRTFWCIERLPTPSYTGVTYFQQWSGFFGPPCSLCPSLVPSTIFRSAVEHAGVIAGLYYGITIIIVSLATAMTVLTLNIHHKGEHGVPVPRLIRKICFDRLLARVLCIRAYNADEHPADTTVWSCMILYIAYTCCCCGGCRRRCCSPSTMMLNRTDFTDCVSINVLFLLGVFSFQFF